MISINERVMKHKVKVVPDPTQGIHVETSALGFLLEALDMSVLSYLMGTAGFVKDDNLGLCWGSVCRCPISILRPDMKTRRKTAMGS